MNIIKQKQMKNKISKISAHNVSNILINKKLFLYLQNISFPSRKPIISSTVNNTNNNSTTSINLNSNLKNKQKTMKNNMYNQKIGSIRKKGQMQFSFGDKINLYKKKIFNQKNINSVGIPIEAASQNTTSQYIKYKYLKPNSNITSDKIIINNTNSNMIINSTTSNISNISINKNNKIPRKNITNNNNMKKPQIKSINTNNYIINTLNLSEKNYINNNAQAQKMIQKNLTEEINKFKKEREELKKIHQKHERLIEKLMEDNKNLSDKIGGIEQENNKLKKKINVYKENQEQLVMLVKIIQQNGVDIEELIDKWNNDIENEEEMNSKEKNEEINSKSIAIDSLNELNGKIDCSSFIPITVQEKKEEKKMKVSGVPKLNFDLLKNNYNQENRNNNKQNINNKKKKDNYINKSK